MDDIFDSLKTHVFHLPEDSKYTKSSFSWKGLNFSEEHKKNLSISMKGKQNALGNKSWTGKKATQETKDKISASLIGNKRAKGFKHTDESKKKNAQSKMKKIVINGVVYESGKEASIKLNVSTSTIVYWLKNGRADYIQNK